MNYAVYIPGEPKAYNVGSYEVAKAIASDCRDRKCPTVQVVSRRSAYVMPSGYAEQLFGKEKRNEL